MEHYTYSLRDPRKILPFYIGKGCGSRPSDHMRDARSTTNSSHKLNTIRKILADGFEVVVIKSKPMSEVDAFDLEMLMIEDYGRRDTGTGCLTNKTNGGEGSSGLIVSDTRKKELSIQLKNNNPMHHPEIVAKVRGDKHWNYGKEPHNKGVKMSPERLEAHKASCLKGKDHPRFGTHYTDDEKIALSKSMIGIKKSDTSNFHWKRKTVECPHCSKVGSVANMKRWHFDNCKEIN